MKRNRRTAIAQLVSSALILSGAVLAADGSAQTNTTVSPATPAPATI